MSAYNGLSREELIKELEECDKDIAYLANENQELRDECQSTRKKLSVAEKTEKTTGTHLG